MYEYEIAQGCGKKGGGGRSGVASEQDKAVNRETTLKRARKMIRWLVNTNINLNNDYSPKFLTLTFKENISSLKSANYEFKKFRHRLEYKFHIKINYLCVPEFQKRGSIHYHVILFNLPFIDADELSSIWGNGFIKINRIDKVSNVGVCFKVFKQR